MYIRLRRRKISKINVARAVVEDLERSLRAYDEALAERGIAVVPCDTCDIYNHMDSVCDECGILTYKATCPRCGETTDWTVNYAVSH